MGRNKNGERDGMESKILTLDTKTLVAALGRVGIAADIRGSLPILSGVKLGVADGRLTLSATNLDIFVTESLEAASGWTGSAVVAYRLLAAFLGRATAKETSIEIAAKTVTVRHGENEGVFEALPADEFPPSVKVEGEPVKCDAADFTTPLRLVSHAMSQQESDYHLRGVHLDSQNGGSTFVATDRRRMSLYKSELKFNGASVIVPDDAVTAILKVVENGECEVILGEKGFRIVNGAREISGNLVEATYPNYKEIAKTSGQKALSVHRKELIEAVSTGSVFLERNDISISLSGKGKEVEVACAGRFKANLLGTELGGQPKLTKSINYRYLLDACRSLEGDTVRMECGEGLPVVFREGPYMEVINSLQTVQ